MEKMVADILLQALLILIGIFGYLYVHEIPQKALAKFREYRSRPGVEAKRHFVLGARTLSLARSPDNSHSTTISLAKKAEDEADKAISLDPKDAAVHILKALSLDLQGFKSSALDSLDVALSPLAVKSLTESEKGDALFKRAELVVGTNRSERVDAAIQDLTQAVKLNKENANAFRLLGECYEAKKMEEEAKSAYEEALKLQPEMASAKAALERLTSSE
ncbi:hypothetical protein JCGZ_15899 [Jatropha curcas]|uniref:Uncharacterized protein n=1 Tax=Jatropha curcas TaxID=180498 RepID=A0A067KZ84_JATCU|nr:uncharacterized protein LOC105630720 [Jatropha curcas]KDP41492.1 hypothetical protein JCGZ_15899 [Jatropha curcas]